MTFNTSEMICTFADCYKLKEIDFGENYITNKGLIHNASQSEHMFSGTNKLEIVRFTKSDRRTLEFIRKKLDNSVPNCKLECSHIL